MKSKPGTGIFVIALGVLIALIPRVIFPVCTGMIELINDKTLFMKCHWTERAELMIGMLIIFDGILIIGFKKYETRIALNIMLFLYGLASLLIPTAVIGMCDAPAMPCRVGTEPALIAAGVITMITGIGNIFSLINSIRCEKPNAERSVIK